MLTNKQRSYLRGLGHKMQPIFQIGKNGLEDNFYNQVDKALEARELIKIKVLNNSDYTAREASDIICEEVNCDGVQAIGNKFLIYRQSKDKQKIELP
ncbi:ribosome assembly RNA-binding protein YhbY [Clostridium sediminicola]|uniref:ribosome assembly RNA-binding protein YhbY n=1 Tax=Clostridium sediminicola TaxID=3114879 RepID=UPI0031F26C9F